MNALQQHSLAMAVTAAPRTAPAENLLGIETHCGTIHFFENGWQAIASQAVPQPAIWLLPKWLPDASAYDCIALFTRIRPADQFVIYSTKAPPSTLRKCGPRVERSRCVALDSLDDIIRILFTHCVRRPYEADLPPPSILRDSLQP